MPRGALAQLTLLTNLPSNDGGGGGVSSSEQRAVSFKTLASSFLVTEVDLRLLNYETSTDTAELSLHLNGTDRPGTQVGSNFTSPTSTTNTASNFKFTTAGIQLIANATYWLVIKATNGDPAFTWNRSNPTVTPATTAFGSFGNQWISNNSGSTWSIGSNGAHSFAIVGVPEPSVTAWMFGITVLGLLVFRVSRRRSLLSKEQSGISGATPMKLETVTFSDGILGAGLQEAEDRCGVKGS